MGKIKNTNRKRGAQPGNRNALTHGYFTKEKIQQRRELKENFRKLAQEILSITPF